MLLKTKLKTLLFMMLGLLTANTSLGSVAYNQGTGAFVQTRYDNLNKDLTGVEATGDYLLQKNVLLVAGFGLYSVSSIDLNLISFGGRYIHNLDSNTDVLVGADLYISNADVGSVSTSSTDVGLAAQIKKRHDEKIQLEGGISLVKGNIGISGGGLYFLENQWAAKGQLGLNDGSLSFLIGAAYFY